MNSRYEFLARVDRVPERETTRAVPARAVPRGVPTEKFATFAFHCRPSTLRADVDWIPPETVRGKDTQDSRCKYAMTASRDPRIGRVRRRDVPRDARNVRETVCRGINRPVCDGQFHPVRRPSIDNEADIDYLEIDFSPLSVRDTIEQACGELLPRLSARDRSRFYLYFVRLSVSIETGDTLHRCDSSLYTYIKKENEKTVGNCYCSL